MRSYIMRDMVFTREHFDRLADEGMVLRSENDQLKAENLLLKEKVHFLMKKLFGRSSERLNPDQMQLALEELADLQEALELAEALADEAEEPQEKPESNRGKRKPLDAKIPEDLPVETVVIEPDEVKANPELWVKIGEERTEQLDVVPTRFFKVVTIRPKYKKIDDRSVAPVVAPAPKRLIENSYASAGLILHIILGKYCDHLPLYRQEQIFKQRFGVEISRKTMGGWMHLMANWLSLIYEALRNEIRVSGYIQADETFIRLPRPQKGPLSQWIPMGLSLPRGRSPVRMVSQPRRQMHRQHAHRLPRPVAIRRLCRLHQLAERSEARGGKKPDHPCRLLGARPAQIRRILRPSRRREKSSSSIAKLYRIETQLRENPELDRGAYRQKHAPAHLEQIKGILETEQPRTRPKSAFGKAIHYTLDRWEMLTEYLRHPALEIDNNLVENAIR
ncbi:MAG: transposase, partial [Verrucomicrobia bacterium]|nr:transposase [Verrucomicrobiota bacterium]